MPDIESYLRGLRIPDSAKADLWDAYMESPDENALASRVKDYGVDSTVKADLWDMKAGRPLPQVAKPEASAAKGLARAVLGQQFRPPAMPKPPAAPALTDPEVKDLAPLPDLPKPAVPFALRTRAPRGDIGDVGMAMGDTGEGLRRMAEFQTAGAKEAAAGAGQMVAPNQPLERRVMGASRVFRGGMQAALPAMLPVIGAAAMAAPAATAFGMLAGTAAQEGVERGAKAVGVPEGYARAAGDLAGLPGYLYGPFRALRPRVPTTTGVVDDAIAPPASIADDALTVLGPAPALAAAPERKLIGPPAARVRRAIVEADAPTKRVVPEPTGDAPVRPDAADVAPQPQPAAKPAATPKPVAKREELLLPATDSTVEDSIFDELVESRLRAVIPDKAERDAFTVKVTETDYNPEWRAAAHNDAFDAVFGKRSIKFTKANRETEFERVANLAMEKAREEFPEEGTFAEVSLDYVSRPSTSGPYPTEQGIALRLVENPTGYRYPSQKVFDRASEIYTAITGGEGPSIPKPRRETKRQGGLGESAEGGAAGRRALPPSTEKSDLTPDEKGLLDEMFSRGRARDDEDMISSDLFIEDFNRGNAALIGLIEKGLVERSTGGGPAKYTRSIGKPAIDTVEAIRGIQGGADAPVSIAKLRESGVTDEQLLRSAERESVQLWESHLNAGHPDVQANPKDFLIRDGKAYNVAYYPPSPRRETQRGSFSRKPRANAKQPQGPEDDFLNFGRIKVTPDEEAALRQTMRGMINRGELVKDVEPHANIIQEAKRIHPDLVREVSAEAAKEGLTSRAAVLSARERMNALNAQILKHIKKRDDPSLDSAARAEIDGQIAAMENNVKEYLRVTSGIRTNFGRNLASLKIMADNTLDFGTWMYKAAKARGFSDPSSVPDKDRLAIRVLIDKAEKAIADGDKKAIDDAKFELARHISKLQEDGWIDTISALRKAGLLTGLRTHVTNIVGNTLFSAMEEASRIPGAFTDIVVSAGTKRRTTAGPSIAGMKNAAYEAATKGVEEAWQVMSRGMTQADMKAGDLPREHNFQKIRHIAENMPENALKLALGRTNDMVNTYINTVFRSLGAEDRVFRVYAMRRSIEAQAKVKAMNEKLSGAKLKARVAELTKNPSDLMISEAIAYSQFATFNTENSAAQMVIRGRPRLPAAGRAVLDLVIPFLNTPMEAAARGTNYIPGTNFIPFIRKGYAAAKKVSAAKQQMKRGAITKDEYTTVKDLMSAQAQKAFSEAMGRGFVGTAIMLAGYMRAKEGKAIGFREENDPMRTVKQAAGQQDGSVLVGGKWRQISRLTPTATLFLMGASMYDQSTRNLSNEMKRPWIMAGTYAKAIADTPMLQGVGMAGDALKDPAKFGEQMISQTAGSFVPTAVSDLSRVIDPSRKEFKPPQDGNDSMLDLVVSPALYGIQGRLPFTRSSQPNARDVFGKDLGGERSYAVDPFSSSTAKEQSDPMFKMMLDARVGIKPVDKITGESHAHYRGRQALAGAAIEKELRRINPERLPSDPEKRDKILKKAISAGRKKARTVWNSKRFLDNPEDRRAEILEQLAERVRGK